MKALPLIFNSILALILIGSANYTFFDYIGVNPKTGLLPKIANVGIVISIFCIILIYYTTSLKFKIYRSLPFGSFACVLLFSLTVSILSNSPGEYMPSVFRFGSYFLASKVAYDYVNQYGIDRLRSTMKGFLMISILVILIFTFLEIILGKVEFVNGANRLAGPFTGHQLGFSLYLFIILLCLLEWFVLPNKRNKFLLFIYILIFLTLFYFFINTHSRALLIIFFLVIAGYQFIRIKSIGTFFRFITVGLIMLGIAGYVILNTDLAPRLKTAFLSEKSLKDPSTMERVFIIENSLNGMNSRQFVTGIGLGGFNNFYERVAGKADVAAHNNYLLFLVEGGGIALIGYVFYQIAGMIFFIRNIRKRPLAPDFWKLGFMCFLGIEIMSFLLNNYYFFNSQYLIWIIFGACFALKSEKRRNVNIAIN